MRTISYLPQMLTVLVVSVAAAAQSQFGFPVNQRFVASSLNGHDYAAKSPTLAVSLDVNRDVLTGVGFAGCNSWISHITLGDKQFGVGNLGTTKMFCVDQMTAEASFLTALKAVTRWRMDGPRLVLEGERTTLLLSPATSAAPNKP